ncbi:MAG TPA: aldo/keto reductase [Lapillicoccus sp.]|nr:aldo/keto reductase [Lapillicoccus sp.]
MKTRAIGDRTVSAIGLGAMQLSISGRPSHDQGLATIHAALDAGVTLVDTADAYSLDNSETGHNERLVGEALRTWGGDASSVLVATKGGHVRPEGRWEVDGSPAHLRAACDASLTALGVEAIGLYQFHRPDPSVPYAESVGALRDLLDAGKIQMAGISNADPAQIREAQEVLGGRLASVQNQFSPAFRSSEPELQLCDELGIAFLPWGPLGGASHASEVGSRFGEFAAVASDHGVSPQQVTLAWMLALSPVVIPIPGSSRPETILDSVAAADLSLSDDEVARLSSA